MKDQILDKCEKVLINYERLDVRHVNEVLTSREKSNVGIRREVK